MRAGTVYSSITDNPKLAGTILLVLIGISLLLIFLFTSRVPQWGNYHQFADTRTLWGIPNFWNVSSNIPFLTVSILGFMSLRRQWTNHNLNKKEAVVFFILFLAVLLISLGSSYYHWLPDNDRLVWDRIPMTIVFMSLLSLTITERINAKLGFWLLFPLMMLGIFSVLYWRWTELSAQGDLRLYGLVQFYSMILIVFILFFFPKSYPPVKAYLGMFVFYGLAKLCEHFDFMIYSWGEWLSGHTLKHLFAAVSAYFLVVILNSKTISSE